MILRMYDIATFAPVGYLKAFDREAHGATAYPTGVATVTDDPAEAMQFADDAAAVAYVKQVSASCPLRPDGKPNRPLTAYHVELVRHG
jgi:hypothetical protein